MADDGESVCTRSTEVTSIDVFRGLADRMAMLAQDAHSDHIAFGKLVMSEFIQYKGAVSKVTKPFLDQLDTETQLLSTIDGTFSRCGQLYVNTARNSFWNTFLKTFTCIQKPPLVVSE